MYLLNQINLKPLFLIFPLLLISFLADDGKFVEVQGKKQYVCDKGTGNPVVVFITGISADHDDFSGIQKQVAKITRTISYDRAGTGESEKSDSERTLANISRELDELLTKEGITQTYILVGHSRGGLIARYFANKYPGKVAGMILIDPSSVEVLSKKRAIRTVADRIKYDSINASMYSKSVKESEEVKDEWKNFYNSDTIQLKGIIIPSTIPVTILASGKYTNDAYNKEDIDIKLDLYKSWLKNTPQIKLVVTEKANHSIHQDQPKMVIDSILSMVAQLRKN